MKNTTRKLIWLLLLLISNFSIRAQGGAVYVNATPTSTFGNPVFSPILNPFGVKWSKTIPAAGGNVLSVGHTDVSGQGENMLLTKFDPSGNMVFSVDFNVAGSSNDYGIGLFEDSSTNVYVCGTTDNGGSYQAVILKYQPSGMLTGTTTISSPGLNYIATALAIHPTTGNLIVAFSAELSSGDFDCVVKELDPNSLAVLNTNKYDYNNLTEVPMGVDINSTSGDIVIVGSSQSSATTWAYALATFDGTTLSYISDARTNIGGFNGDDPLAYKIDNNNCVYITGRTWNSGTNNFDIKTVKIGSSYSIAWTSTLDVNGGDDYGNSVDVDGSGHVIVGGFCTNNSGKKDFFCIKYNGSTGGEMWRYSEPSMNLTGDASLLKLRVNQSTSSIYYISSQKNVSSKNEAVVGKIKANGEKSWFKTISNAVYDVIPSDLEINGNEIYAISILDPVSPSYQMTNFNELELDTTRIYRDSIPTRLKNCLVVRFKQNAVIPSKINDKQLQHGTVSDFIYSSALATLIDSTGLRDLGSYKCYKALPWMVMDDTLSISRSGRTVKVDPHYTTFGLILPGTSHDSVPLKKLLNATTVVRTAEYNRLVLLHATANDPEFTNGHSAGLSPNSWTLVPDANINVEPAWDLSSGDPAIKVGVYDTGINFAHSDFGNGTFSGSKIVGGFDYYGNVSLSQTSSNDVMGHGTAVADKIGALRNNNFAVAGVAGGDGNGNTGVSLYDMKIYGQGTDCGFNKVAWAPEDKVFSAIVQGAVYNPTTQTGYGLHIQNHSWGGGLPLYGVILDGFITAFQNECMMVASSGNNGVVSNCMIYSYPASYKDHIVTKVGANYESGERTPFSECGHRLDIIAPGVKGLYSSLTRTGSAVSDNMTWTSSGSANCSSQTDGTSFAAPHVAGSAALMLSYASNTFMPNGLFPEDIEHLFELAAKDLTFSPFFPGYDSLSGFGRLNIGQALNEYYYPGYLVQHYSFNVAASGAFSVGAVFENTCLWQEMFNQPFGIAKVKRYKITGSHNHTIPSGYTFVGGWERNAGSNLMGINTNTAGLSGTAINCLTTGVVFEEDRYIPDATQILPVSITSTSASFDGYIYEIYDSNNNPVGWYPFGPTGTATFAYSIYLKSLTVGIKEDLFTENAFYMYPNPTTNKVYFKSRLKEIESIDIAVYSNLGQLVLSEDNLYIRETNSIDVSFLNSGIYFVKLTSGNKTIVNKLIVSK